MFSKLRYDPITKKLLKPIVKFNGGYGAIICNKCSKIIKENLSFNEFRGKTKLLFCSDCTLQLLKQLFKTDKHEN